MKERSENLIGQIEKDNALMDFVNYQAQEAILDPNIPDWFKDKLLQSTIATIKQIGERKTIYNAEQAGGQKTRQNQ